MSQRISFRSLYKLFIWRPHSTAKKISEGCLISTISTRMRKHHCCKCFSAVACHEDGCQDHRLALRSRGIIWERCCSMLLLARTASYAWFKHSALLHLGRHPTRVQVFRQETSPPWSGQAFWYAQDIQTKMKPRYVFPTCGSSEKETSKLQLDTPNWRTATCSGELFVWLSEL